MRNDMHIHMILDGADFRTAIASHREQPCDDIIRKRLDAYRSHGVTFLRDGGDARGVCIRAKQLAPEYNIDYRMPAWPIHRIGHYGGFIGRGYHDLKEYEALIGDAATAGADFIKIMISGLMDFGEYGKLTEPSLPADEIHALADIAHGAGFSVMAHCNGTEATIAAAEAGIESIEHGAYLNDEALSAMLEARCVWVPTLSAIANPIGSGRFPDDALMRILDCARNNIQKAAAMGIPIGCGSDAGAFCIMHPGSFQNTTESGHIGAQTEEALLREILGGDTDAILSRAEALIRDRFRSEKYSPQI